VLVAGSESLFQQRQADVVISPSMTRREPEVTVFLQSLARLAARGLHPDVTVLFGSNRRFVRLPGYPWRHGRYWYEAPADAELRRGRFEHPFLKRQTRLVTEDGPAVWEAALGVAKFPCLRDHQVDGEIVFPATGHLGLAWAVAGEQFPHEAFFLEDLRFDSPLIFSDKSGHPPDVRLEIVSGEGDYRVCSRPADAARDVPWTRHSSGRINATHDRFEKADASLADLRERFLDGDEQPVEAFYEARRRAGLDYGDHFRCVQQLWQRGHELLARVELGRGLLHESQRFTVHPALLDACLHVVFADVHRHGDPGRAFLPYRIDRVRFHRRPGPAVWSHVRVTRNDEQFLCSDTLIFDDAGELVAEVLGLTCKRLAGGGARQADGLYEGCYEYRWASAPWDPSLHGRFFDCTRVVLITAPGQEGEGVAAELAARLSEEGLQFQLIRPDPRDSFGELLADVPLDRRTTIVFLAGPAGLPGWKGLAACPDVPSLLQLAQTLQKREGVPRLFVVTRGTAGVPGDRDLDLAQAVLHGMGRVIKNECANVPLTVIDLSEPPPPVEVEALYRELLHSRRDRDEAEIALRGQGRFVRQLVAVDRESAEETASTEEAGVGGDYRADQSEPGTLDAIVFRRSAPDEPGEQDVEIAVEAAALNFKDVMNAMGLLPEVAVAGGLTAHRLGLEVAGRVLRTGREVQHVRAGDEVIARVPEGFRGRVITHQQHVIRKPEGLTPTEGASIPLAYVTAWYSLCHLARLARGETVLIHSAAGGVGGAALQLAQRAGATVIATAGTKEKRAYLRGLGVEHVFDSRSLDFYNRVMEVTGSRGVDVVLNSLAGRLLSQSIKCLSPFGRFVELGKSDIYRNAKLNLQRLGENASYFVVDVDRLAAQKPELHRQILTEVVALFERGELRLPEINAFPASRLPEALRLMSRAAYRGKIVLDMRHGPVRALPPRQVTFRPDRCYLISGGASGFGLEVARWMVGRGARHLVLLSRSGCKSDADRLAVEAMMEQGVKVLLAQKDVADRAAVGRLIERLRSEMPPLAGVIHGAAVLDDASIPSMDLARFGRVFLPKAQGAWNLHEATADAGLDFFVMLSSISSVLGLYGQLNYACANFFQDALAQYRRQRGLPATSVNLGVLGDYAGMSRRDEQDVLGLLQSHGLPAMGRSEVLAKLEAALTQQPAQRMAAQIDWARFRAAYPQLARDARFVDLMSDAALARGVRRSGSDLRAALAEAEPETRRGRLEQELTAALARILGAAPEKLDVAAPIDNLGLDSLMLTQLRNWALRSLDVNLPLIKLLKGPSITDLAAELLGQLDGGGRAGGEAAPSPGQASFSLADLEGVRVLSPWLIRGSGSADSPCRLVCFHSMGVGASLFTSFLLHPPQGYDVLAVQTPGRENRSAEPVAESFDVLADQIVPQVLPLFDRPVVIWGHSFGGIVAAEVVRRLRDRHHREPAHLLVTGTIAPPLIHHWQTREVILKSLIADNSPEYLTSLSRYIDDPEFLKAILPGIRRDYHLLTSYRYEPMPPLSCPVTAYAAKQDDVVYPDEVREWSRLSPDGFRLIEVDGDHWFLKRNHKQITETLNGVAATLQAGGSPVEAVTAAAR
jgi:NADPH:quinone reductase-like Zn-dependent oxidoreductase/surfactin synthase thioesterase subunit/NADP-dependent 3-hydroxy acid dehydrogenase YdfG